MKTYQYTTVVNWTGNLGLGTSNYKAYSRNHTITSGDKPVIESSSDPAFLGDRTRYNPEELLLASLSSCHMLWYLHLCAEAGIVVINYTDAVQGVMEETANGGGRFTLATLNPVVTVQDSNMVDKANQLHQKANELCFIANSVTFKVHHRATCLVAESDN